MPFLFIDLDNTIADREGSVRRWAAAYVEQRLGRPDPALAEAVFVADGDGIRPKPEVADDLQRLLGLTDDEKAEVIKVLRAGVLEYLLPDPDVDAALTRATGAGWTPFVVTNGNVVQQNSKLDILGLRPLVAGMVVSEGVGVRKPDPRIFDLAAEAGGGTLEGAWMVGDTAAADIAGAQAAGIRSIWMRRGRDWPADQQRPTAIVDTFAEAVEVVLASE
ncbi:MAG: HAD family hydrolase [Dermatophilus congolensis]|nr:HAD family hydrolase [Dermatophilus congolensis]